jgi:2,3-bisphosphoglycerate-independent phosphoglycerate mutase
MKYVIVIPDGAADKPIAELDGLTPLEAADAPNLARLAAMGQQGTVRTTPPGFTAGSDVCCMTLLGYDAGKFHTGRAPLECAALGVAPGNQDWIFRLNLVTTSDEEGGLMLDHSAGAITDGEARWLVRDLMAAWKLADPHLGAEFSLHPGVSYRNILIDKSGRDYRGSIGGKDRLITFPPHEIPRKPWRTFLPRGAHADRLTRLMEISREVFSRHEVNLARRENGLRPASMAWIWGQGVRPQMPSFQDRFKVRAAITTAVDLLAGIAAYTGVDRVSVPGLTSYHDNDYAAQGRYSAAALDRYDLVIVHIEAPDEASHQGDWQTKIAALEAIDRHVIGPMMERLGALRADGGRDPAGSTGGWRMLVAPDHYTLCSTLKHDGTPPPFVMAGTGIKPLGRKPFTEAQADAAALHIEPGEALMEHFLWGGIKKPGE